MFKPNPTTIYLGDNGRAYCGDHLGMTGKASGHDISGQPLYAITPNDLRAEPTAAHIECEQPGCGRRPSPIWTQG